MKNLKKLLKKGEILDVLKIGSYGRAEFRKAGEHAYMSNKFEKQVVGKYMKFEQGYGRNVLVPIEIVEDIVGRVA